MREFKFRVWNIEEKDWANPEILEVWNGSGKLEPFGFVKTGKLNPLYHPIENFVIQQFTGLTDKHGKEIYEGDIVKCPDLNPPEYTNTLSVIEFRGSAWCYKRILTGKIEAINDFIGLENQDGDAEIIGNIFENPELLK